MGDPHEGHEAGASSAGTRGSGVKRLGNRNAEHRRGSRAGAARLPGLANKLQTRRLRHGTTAEGAQFAR